MNSKPSQIFGIYLISMSILTALLKTWCSNSLVIGGACSLNMSNSANSLLFIYKTNLASLVLGTVVAVFPEGYQNKFSDGPKIFLYITSVVLAIAFTLLSLG